MQRRFFRKVAPLPDYRLKVELENGSSVCFDFTSRLRSVRFGALLDYEVFKSVHTDGYFLIFCEQQKEKLRIAAEDFIDLLLVDRTQ